MGTCPQCFYQLYQLYTIKRYLSKWTQVSQAVYTKPEWTIGLWTEWELMVEGAPLWWRNPESQEDRRKKLWIKRWQVHLVTGLCTVRSADPRLPQSASRFRPGQKMQISTKADSPYVAMWWGLSMSGWARRYQSFRDDLGSGLVLFIPSALEKAEHMKGQSLIHQPTKPFFIRVILLSVPCFCFLG